MRRSTNIQLTRDIGIPILFENRSILAVDKPAHWILAPHHWDNAQFNLQLAIAASIQRRDFWAKSRNLKYLRNVHRLDAETTGVLLFAKSPGALHTLGRLFESREMHKTYLAVANGVPAQTEWVSRESIGPEADQPGRMRIDPRDGKPAETFFRVLQIQAARTRCLIEARPVTGRTHQIRLHLQAAGCSVLGDAFYANPNSKASAGEGPMALRAVHLAYNDPFTRQRISIHAPKTEFLKKHGFDEVKGPTAGEK